MISDLLEMTPPKKTIGATGQFPGPAPTILHEPYLLLGHDKLHLWPDEVLQLFPVQVTIQAFMFPSIQKGKNPSNIQTSPTQREYRGVLCTDSIETPLR